MHARDKPPDLESDGSCIAAKLKLDPSNTETIKPVGNPQIRFLNNGGMEGSNVEESKWQANTGGRYDHAA